MARKHGSQLMRKSAKELKLWSANRLRVASFVEDKRFDLFIGVIILANSIVLVLETDQRAKCEDPDNDECNKDILFYTIAGNSFLLVYIIELVLKFFCYRLNFFQSTWNQFDFLIVAVSILSEMLGGMIPAISVVRVFRAARLAKVFRVLMVYKELYMIIFGFASAMRAIIWASFLIFLLLTIWSIFAVELLHPVERDLGKQGLLSGCDRCHRAFESVMASNLTFLQTILSGDSWGTYAIPIIEEHPHLSLLFIGVWSTVVLGFGNLILAVIVDCAAEARRDDLAYQERIKLLGEEAAMQQFLKLCGELDTDGSGQLSYSEFIEAYNNSAELVQMLKVLNIESAELPMLFTVMDDDKSGDIDYQEFANSIHRMRSSESYVNFTFIKHEIREVRELAEKQFNNLHGEISSLADSLRGMCSKSIEQGSFIDPAKLKPDNCQMCLKSMEQSSLLDPAKPVPENYQNKSCQVKDTMHTRMGGGSVLADELFQHEVKLKLDELAASVMLLVSKTIQTPAEAELEFFPDELLSLPQSHVAAIGCSGPVLAHYQQSKHQSGTLRTRSPRHLPQGPPKFLGSCGRCTLPQTSKIQHCWQDEYARAPVQTGA